MLALQRWQQLAGITDGPLLRSVGKGNKAGTGHLHPEAVNSLVQQAVARAGLDPSPCSAHSLRAGFVTYAHLRGASGGAIAHQTRHRSLATLGGYVRVQQAWTNNAATSLGLQEDGLAADRTSACASRSPCAAELRFPWLAGAMR